MQEGDRNSAWPLQSAFMHEPIKTVAVLFLFLFSIESNANHCSFTCVLQEGPLMPITDIKT